MGPKYNSGFYLSRALVLLLALLVGALLLAVIVLASLYAHSRCSPVVAIESATEGVNSTALPTPAATPTVPSQATSGTPEPPGIWNNVRLPASPLPIHYQLELWPHLEADEQGAFPFSGQVNITLRCSEAEQSAVLLLHSLRLNVSQATLMELDTAEEGGQLREINRIWYSTAHNYLVLELQEPLRQRGQYVLQLHYHGYLSKRLIGLFISHYIDQGQDKLVVASQLEPTYARTVYPCFDEPALKATFDTRIVHRPNYVALSNMPAISVSEREDDNGTKWSVTTFNTTLKMSTYITAFVVCDFDYINTTDERGHQIRIWARKQLIHNGSVDFALNITGPILRFMEQLLNVSYPLQKTDLVALPDFKAGAMENWGLMTFQEYSLICDIREKQAITKAMTSLIVSHELGHQWFGNLVTMKWWNDIWLNEGFATYMEYIGTSFIEPRLKLNEFFLLNNIHTVFSIDSRVSRPLSAKEEDIRLAKHINPLFDYITYAKGASLVRMISSFMTEMLFIKGISSYLKTFAFSNVEQDDLWDQLQMVIDEQDDVQLPTSIKDIMDSWTWQSGIPLLTLNTSTGTITEEKLYQDLQEKNDSHDNHTWIVPISWMKTGQEQPLIWLDNRSKVFPEMQISSEHEWIILNVNMTGYYRTNYDQQNWDKLIAQLEKDPKAIPVVNRVQLIEDAFTFLRAGFLDIDTALSLTKYLAKEEELLVWNTLHKNNMFFRSTLADYTTFPLWKNYMVRKISPVYHYYESVIRSNLKEAEEDYFVQMSLDNLISTACSFGLQECLDLARELFTRWMNDPTDCVPATIQRSIYCYGISLGSEKEWEFALAMMNKEPDPTDASDLRYGLSCTKEPWLLNRYLEYALTPTTSGRNEIFLYVSQNEIGRHVAWDFVTTHWERIHAEFEHYVDVYDFVISIKGQVATTDIQVQEIELFINSTMDEENKKTAMHVLEIAKHTASMSYMNKMKSNISDWLRKNTEVADF